MINMEIYKNPNAQAESIIEPPSDLIYKFANYSENVPQGKVRLYHQTTLPKIKQILADKHIKGDVWGQENIDNWNYGDFAIAYDVDPASIHKANDTDRIIYGNVPIESFSHIKAMTPRTKIGVQKVLKELGL